MRADATCIEKKVIGFLKNYNLQKAFCENAQTRIDMLKMCRPTPERGEEIKCLETQRDLARRQIEMIDRACDLLSESEKKTISEFYINRRQGHVDRLCEALFCEERSVYKYKEQAMNKLCAALFGNYNNI